MAEPPKQGRRLTVLSDAAGVDPGTPLQAPFEAPALRRFSTPDCMSSPVSYLRDMTHGLEEGVRRERAAQFLLESRLAHLQQRRLYLVLDLPADFTASELKSRYRRASLSAHPDKPSGSLRA